MAEYIEREAVMSKLLEYGIGWGAAKVKGVINSIPAADVAPVHRWISVTERLPEANKPAVYCTINNDVKLGVYIPKAQAWTQTEVFAWVRGDAVTHWIPIPEPLPEPPKEETE